MYEGDSFYTLTLLGRTGLILLSTAMAFITIGLFLKVSSRYSKSVGVGLAIVFLGLFVSLSPQFYYTYYMLIFEGLPVQSVIRKPPGPVEIFQFLTFTEDATFSKHAKGVLGWVLIVLALRKRTRAET